jgi:hypothetical protein
MVDRDGVERTESCGGDGISSRFSFVAGADGRAVNPATRRRRSIASSASVVLVDRVLGMRQCTYNYSVAIKGVTIAIIIIRKYSVFLGHTNIKILRPFQNADVLE